jgi:hypothetical protein
LSFRSPRHRLAICWSARLSDVGVAQRIRGILANLRIGAAPPTLIRLPPEICSSIESGGPTRRRIRPDFGLEFPWQVTWFAPDVITLVNVQNSNAPAAVFMRQIVEVPRLRQSGGNLDLIGAGRTGCPLGGRELGQSSEA